MFWILFFVGVLVPLTAQGFDLYRSDSFSLELKGSYKNLYFTSRRRLDDTTYNAQLNRIRTDWGAHLFGNLSARVIWDNELIGGNYVATEEFTARQQQRGDPYPDMDFEIVRKGDFFYGQQLTRATGRLDTKAFNLTIGRHKVDWGVMRLLSPSDLFSRLSIFTVEKEERVGVTAANLVVPLGPSLRINPVTALDPNFDRSRVGCRITKTVGHFDLSVLGGKFLKDAVFGFDFSGDIRKAGLRGEFLFDRTPFAANFFQSAVGIDYGFENTFSFALEYLFNGQGTNQSGTMTPFPFPFPETANPIQTVHKNFLSAQFKYEPSPLLVMMLHPVVDLNGGSLFINPEIKYSAFEWIEVQGGAHLPVGKQGGEFTPIPNLYTIQSQLFF